MAKKRNYEEEKEIERASFYQEMREGCGDEWHTGNELCKVKMWWECWLKEGVHYITEIRTERTALTPNEVIECMENGCHNDGRYPFISFEYEGGIYYRVVKQKYFKII